MLVPGAKAPELVTDELVARMKPGSVLVDIAIDQGGCFEGSRPTTHADPTYRVHDSLFYCVANMPGAVPHTSTYALTNVTLPYVVELANRGWREALRADPALALGLNTHEGACTCAPVADAHGLPSVPPARSSADHGRAGHRQRRSQPLSRPPHGRARAGPAHAGGLPARPAPLRRPRWPAAAGR